MLVWNQLYIYKLWAVFINIMTHWLITHTDSTVLMLYSIYAIQCSCHTLVMLYSTPVIQYTSVLILCSAHVTQYSCSCHISGAGRSMKEVVVLSPVEYNYTFVAGPAQFGPNFGINNFVSISLTINP